MSKLFEATEINGMKLANRFARSATWEGMAADDGACTPRLIVLLQRLAEGGVGLIITGLAYITRKSMAAPWQLGIDGEACLPGLKCLTDAVHRANGRIVVQIAHGGCYSAVRLTG